MSVEKLQALETARQLARMDLRLATMSAIPLAFPPDHTVDVLHSSRTFHTSTNNLSIKQKSAESPLEQPVKHRHTQPQPALVSRSKPVTLQRKPAATRNAAIAVVTQPNEEKLVGLIQESTAPLARQLSRLLSAQHQQTRELNEFKQSLKNQELCKELLPTAASPPTVAEASSPKENIKAANKDNVAKDDIDLSAKQLKKSTSDSPLLMQTQAALTGEQQRSRMFAKDSRQLELADRQLAKSFQRVMEEERLRSERERERRERIRELAAANNHNNLDKNINQHHELATSQKQFLLQLLRQRFSKQRAYLQPRSTINVGKRLNSQYSLARTVSIGPEIATFNNYNNCSNSTNITTNNSSSGGAKNSRRAIKSNKSVNLSSKPDSGNNFRKNINSADRLALNEALSILDRITSGQQKIRSKLDRLNSIPRNRRNNSVRLYTADSAVASGEPKAIVERNQGNNNCSDKSSSNPKTLQSDIRKQSTIKFHLSNYSLQRISEGRDRWMDYLRSRPLPFSITSSGLEPMIAEPEQVNELLDRMGDQLVDDLLDATCQDLSVALGEIVETLFRSEFAPTTNATT